MPDLQGALWAWVQSLPPWQSDLLRRLTVIETITEFDLADAMSMVLGSFGVGRDDAPTPIPIPALLAPTGHQVTRILSVRDFVSVGSVEVGQRLDFSLDGVTVVFGETGSGKSSYVRVLRKACRSCAKPVDILPNVLGVGPGSESVEAGSAIIDVSLDGTASQIKRGVNDPPERDLAEVNIFDSDCAAVYADRENEITYTPSSLRLFERLVALQAQLRRRIDDDVAKIDRDSSLATADFDASTKAGALVNGLSEHVSIETVDALAILTPEDTTRLVNLRARVATAKANDPFRFASQLERRAAAVDDTASVLRSYVDGMNDRVVGDIVEWNEKIAHLEAASRELSSDLSTHAAKPVGSQAWKTLWQAAHSYIASVEHGASFPPPRNAEKHHCPLCQQVLTDEALQRLDRFDQHFKGQIEKDLELARSQRKALLARVSGAVDSAKGRVRQENHLVEDEPALEMEIETFLASAIARGDAIAASGTSVRVGAPVLAPAPLDGLINLVARLRKEAREQRALAAPDAIVKAEKDIVELENRQLLAKRRESVLARIGALKKIARMRAAHSTLATTGLSRRIGELTETAVTEQLRNQLAAELQALGADRIPIMIGARGAKGKTRVSLHLDSTRPVNVSDVLSEGERRAVALAFFLAEVAVAEHAGGIVLDDPVSSLDHTRRSYVARRLVEEASRRQTIVFTHDIVFLLELQDHAKQAGRSIENRMVRRVGSASGVASNDLPWIAQNVKKRIGFLKSDKQRLNAIARRGDAEVYRREVKVWYELLRETWERAVEEKLFGGVVGRFQPGIQTLKLDRVIVTSEMTAAVDRGMTKASAWTHDQAPALAKPPPTSVDLSASISEFEAFLEQFKSLDVSRS